MNDCVEGGCCVGGMIDVKESLVLLMIDYREVMLL